MMAKPMTDPAVSALVERLKQAAITLLDVGLKTDAKYRKQFNEQAAACQDAAHELEKREAASRLSSVPKCEKHGDPLICLPCEDDDDRVWAERGYVTTRTPARPASPAATTGAAEPPLMTWMTTDDPVKRDAAYLRMYAEHARNGTDLTWDIPNTRASTLANIADRMESRLSAASRPAPTWQPIESAPERRKVIVSWVNSLGNRRTTFAAFYPAGTLELDEAPDDMLNEDGTNAEDGWFECREAGDAVDWHLNEKLDFWMPLPAPPGPGAQEK